MKFIYVIIFILLCSTNTYANDKWSKIDKTLYTGFLRSLRVDFYQTNFIKQSDDYYEKNKILDKLNENERALYFIGCGIVGYYIADNLKPISRKLFLGTINIMQFNVIDNNKYIGIKINYDW